MKIKDFDFRLVLTPAQLADLQCDNKDCPCQSPLAYGNEAKCMLGECIDTEAEVELWSGAVDRKGVRIYKNDIVRDSSGSVLIVSICSESSGWILLEADFSPYSSLVEILQDGGVEVLGNIHENPKLLPSNKGSK